MSITRKIQVRRGTTSQWSTANPTLSSGEIGYDSTVDKIKIGDGATAWNSLAFAHYTPSEVDAVVNTAFAPITMPQSKAPTSAPDRTAGAAGAMTGIFYYTVSFVNALGETECFRPAQAITVSSQRVNLSNIPIGPAGTIARRIYRGDNTGYNYKLLATINDNTTTTYEDNVPFGSVPGPLERRWNSTGGYVVIDDEVRMIADAAFTAFGEGQSRTSIGEFNSLFGSKAGASLTVGYWNTFIGANAGEFTEDGWENTFIGMSAGRQNISGYYNTGCGMGSLESLTDGGDNSALGRSAGGSLTTGARNNFMGYGAGERMTDAFGCIVIGVKAAVFQADGTTSCTSANSCIYIGNDIRTSGNSEVNAIVIGCDGRGLGDNSTVIGTVNTTQARIYGSLQVMAGDGSIAAVTIDEDSDPVGSIVLKSDSDGNATITVGVSSAYNAIEFPASETGTMRLGARVSFTTGVWQRSNDTVDRLSFDGAYTRIRGTGSVSLQDVDYLELLTANRSGAGTDDMCLILLDPTSFTYKRVSRGPADSGGTGYRVLRILN